MKSSFSIKEAVGFGWEKTKEHLWFLVGLFLFVAILAAGTDKIPGISFLIAIFASISIITAVLKISAGEKVAFKNLFEKYNVVLQYLVASILYCIMVVLGLILFIFPGIYLALKFQFFRFLVVEKGMGPIEALRDSGRMAKGNIWNLFKLISVLAAINLLGALIFGIGLLVTIPMTILALVYVYKKLLARTPTLA